MSTLLRSPARTAAALALLAAASHLPAPAAFPPGPGTRAAAAQQVAESDYARAEQFLPWNAAKLISGDQVVPEFFDGDRFWFRSRTGSGHEFVVVDPAAATRRPAFDHARLAAALSMAADTAYEGRDLPFETFEFVDGGAGVRFQVADSVQWTCDIGAYTCAGPTTATASSDADRPSPDGRWITFARDENLWVRDAASGAETQLTRDGETDFGYGAIPEGCCQEITSRRAGRERSPVMQWSPDSRRIATHRYDEREVERFHLLEAADGRPILHSWAYALPGDSIVPTSELWILDVEAGTSVRADIPPQPGNFTGGDTAYADVQWTADGSEVFYTHRSRDFKSYRLYRVDAATGAATQVLEETGTTYVELNQFTRYPPAWRVIGDGSEFLWWSERDGFGHLYLYDGDGNLRNRVTSGPWLVMQLLTVDEATRTAYFTAVGREEGRHPYHSHLYRVGLDGSGLRMLSPEDAVHLVTPSPSGRYFLDQYSTPETAPTAVVRGQDGRVVPDRRDRRHLQARGSRLDPARPLRGQGARRHHQRLRPPLVPVQLRPRAELPGGRLHLPGPPGRRRHPVQLLRLRPRQRARPRRTRLHRLRRRRLRHTAALQGLPRRLLRQHGRQRHPRSHLGAQGTRRPPPSDGPRPRRHLRSLRRRVSRRPTPSCAGRISSRWRSRAPATTTTAAITSCGGEKYQGLLVENPDGTDSFDSQANQNIAANLKGKLLLHYGTLDDNVHPNMTVRVIDELIRHNKDFDMFVLPNRNHGYSSEPYVVRRTWDYFIEHLRGETPPDQYRITGAGGVTL